MTGAIPAEYVGAAGLISNVITKSGSNNLQGSANYFIQNDNLVAENKHASAETFSTKDSAFTVGGSVYRDKAWFFRQLSLPESQRRRFDAGHERVHAQRRQHPAPGIREGQLGGDQRGSRQRDVPQRSDGSLGTPAARHHERSRSSP